MAESCFGIEVVHQLVRQMGTVDGDAHKAPIANINEEEIGIRLRICL